MIKQDEYRDWYIQLGLTLEQVKMLSEILESMMQLRPVMIQLKPGDSNYYAGKCDGLNSAFRLITGTLDAHDEFGD